jgi:uncharacterized protein
MRPIHFEILTEDPGRAAAFYREVFGWETKSWEGETQEPYTLVTTGMEGTPGIDGGIMKNHFPQAVINTIDVESLDEMVRKVESAGGQKAFGPHEVPGVGMHAYCSDPTGVLFGLIQMLPQS